MIFWDFLQLFEILDCSPFLKFVWFLGFFMDFFFVFVFLDFFWFYLHFWTFFGFLIFFEIFLFFCWIFIGFLGFLSKFLRLLLKVTKVTTGHQKLPKMGRNSIISSFFAQRAKRASAEGWSPPQELEVGPRSGPYLLVFFKFHHWIKSYSNLAGRRGFSLLAVVVLERVSYQRI